MWVGEEGLGLHGLSRLDVISRKGRQSCAYARKMSQQFSFVRLQDSAKLDFSGLGTKGCQGANIDTDRVSGSKLS